jgi:Flp pilus assembly pilin Flp
MRRQHTRVPVTRFARDRGATAVEYAMIMMVIALVVVLAASALGEYLQVPLTGAADCVEDLSLCPTG